MVAQNQGVKQELISKLLETRTAILHESSHLTPTAHNTVSLGAWSVKDLIARGYPIRGTRKSSGLIAKGR